MTKRRLILLLTALPAFGTPAAADSCGDLAGKVAAATKAEVGERIEDFVRFKAEGTMTLSLSCGGTGPSSVGAQYLGEPLPEDYYSVFGKAGQAVSGVAADTLVAAAHKARIEAETKRHSTVPTGGVLVTCSFTRSAKGPLTMCAAIEKADRS
ncbi:hypothetical protein [Methylobacterium gnaphalii]|uniref:ABC transporter ATPase n=1 Tax=Methylobacterium gnaphalii TaxID=1010610 RepID=A0A512JPL4_9HYPH|nr:hypothetical protein [Methylobacterium gnaphalii]GEP11888.1 hypothetical protein MGN01_37330 [Methylobacterium gnaphalii]GJD68956.1 hypothetical protein MMMDOFMJ_1882 [Methylobacterium gnaphalii]GLS47676.1 hypothetical protein GCM10007885_05200 [Methylobacterium gnaphalii]